MNNWIDRLERRYSRFAIPYLVNGLMVGQLAAGLIVLLINWQFSGFISLSRSAVLHGQIWRLITFLFQPVWLGGALGILNLVFYFWIGNSLTRAWGDFRMTLFIALGVLGAWTGWSRWALSGWASGPESDRRECPSSPAAGSCTAPPRCSRFSARPGGTKRKSPPGHWSSGAAVPNSPHGRCG